MPRANDGEHEKELNTLLASPIAKEKKMPGLKWHGALDSNTIAFLAMLAKDHCSNCFRGTAENDELRRW